MHLQHLAITIAEYIIFIFIRQENDSIEKIKKNVHFTLTDRHVVNINLVKLFSDAKMRAASALSGSAVLVPVP